MDPAPRTAQPRVTWFIAIVAAAFIGGAASGGLVSLLVSNDSPGPAQGPAEASRVITSEQSAVSEAVEKAGPSIVTIVNQRPPFQDEDGNILEGLSVGTGVIVDDRGYIVTNEHVVADPGQLSVVMHDGQERPASIVATDAPFTDLAVLRIGGGNLRAAPFGDSERLQLGQTVIAIGSALFEYRNSVTVGVVSGLGRRYLRNNVYMEDLIQTDAAINSGNSGGPLLTTSGEVVGLTTNVVRRIGATTDVYGIAFAISSRTMEPIVRSIIERGAFPRPYVGIDHLDVDDAVAAQLGLRAARGSLVQRVVVPSPAQAAGIRAGDIILRVGRFDLTPELPFLNALARLTPRERVAVQLVRDGRTMEVSLEVGER